MDVKDENKALLSIIRRYEKALKAITEIHNYDGFKAKEIAKEALQE